MSGRNMARRFCRHCRRNWYRSMARVSVTVVWRAWCNLPRHFQKKRLLRRCRNSWAGARTRKGSYIAQWAHGKKGGNEDLRCQVGISSSFHLAPRSRNYAVTTCDHIDREALQLVTNCDQFTGRRFFKITICDLKESHCVAEALLRFHCGVIWSIKQQIYVNRGHHGEHLTSGKDVGGRKASGNGIALGRLVQQGGWHAVSGLARRRPGRNGSDAKAR